MELCCVIKYMLISKILNKIYILYIYIYPCTHTMSSKMFLGESQRKTMHRCVWWNEVGTMRIGVDKDPPEKRDYRCHRCGLFQTRRGWKFSLLEQKDKIISGLANRSSCESGQMTNRKPESS